MFREVELYGNQFTPVLDTIFLGGGTPSMTDPASMEKIFSKLFQYTSVGPQTEWTMEANPSSVDRDRMKAYHAIGVNRVSMGVQSMKNDQLLLLGRVHDRTQALRALESLFAAGITNVSVDLLCGVPGQTIEDLRLALDELTSFPITHLSCYILTLAEKHRMFPDLPKEDTQLEHYLFLDQYMTAKGFEHYEISNFAKPGFRARHNLVYWTGGAYLGLGPSAHSFDPSVPRRFKNFSSIHRYGETLKKGEFPVEWEEKLTAEQREIEKWMLAVRLADGFPQSWIQSDRQKSKLKQMLDAGYAVTHAGDSSRYRLTPQGFVLSEQIVKELLSN